MGEVFKDDDWVLALQSGIEVLQEERFLGRRLVAGHIDLDHFGRDGETVLFQQAVEHILAVSAVGMYMV